MGNFLKKLSGRFNKSAAPDASILEQSPNVLLSDLVNIEYSVSAAWDETEFESHTNKHFHEQNPHNKVVIYGKFFRALYRDYFERLTFKTKNRCSPRSGYYPNYPWEVSVYTSIFKRDKRPYITDYAYEQMPKRYRDVFKKYNSKAYVLNTNAAPHKIFIIKPKDRPEMELLLFDIFELLGKSTYGHFVEDTSKKANDVTTEQIDDIKKLRDVCVKLNSITQPGFKHSFAHAGENHKKRHGAYDVYNEYTNTLAQKDRYLKLQEQIKAAKQKQLLKQQAAVSEYNTTRSLIIADAKKQITK